MAKKTTPAVAPGAGTVTDEMKSWAFVGVLLPIIGYVIILLAKKGGAYAEYYGKQGLVLGIVCVLVNVIGWVVGFIPFIGWAVHMMLWAALFILWVIGIVYAFSGERRELPLIGEFANRF